MEKRITLTSLIVFAILLTSCNTVRVASDYDSSTDFKSYKTFAFFKPGIDKAEINDIDKRRILRAIETELIAKGYTKSKNPDMLVSIFTKSSQRVTVYNNSWGLGGWGWGAWGGPRFGGNQVSTQTQGTLYIDLINASKKELIWQGSGTGYLTSKNVEKKEARIKEFVAKLIAEFPPE